ncbi:MAG: M1 family aminopeptidase [Candidatus Hermodarchaeota archaeon]
MKTDKFKLLMKQDGFTSPKAEKHYPPSLQLEPIHQIIKLKFDIEKKTAKGSVITTIKANIASANKIELNAIDLEIHEVKGASSWDYDGKVVQILWDKPFKKDEKRELVIEYTVEQPISGMYFSYPDDKYPKRPIYVVTDLESERGRYWLPCIDHPAVRCTLEFYLTSQKNHTILANGKLVEETEYKDGTKTAHWKLDFPCPSYLITLAVGEFISYEDRSADAGKGKIPVAYYTTKQYTPEDLERSFGRTPEMLEWFWKKLKTPLYWPKYFQIATAAHQGAMENISLVTWNDRLVLDEYDAKEMTWLLDAVNVHEMAHSWFGDMVVIREFTHGWLKESWAVYMETAYYEDKYGKNADETLYDLYLNARSYMQESDTRYARPIVTNLYDHSWMMYDRHLYPGGAWRIHMLSHIVGENFWNAVTDYLKTYEGKVVETVDFQRKLEDHSGLSLQEFFEQWLYSPGYPKLKASFKYDDKSQLCSLKIEQTQVDEKKNIGIFKFPLEIMWETKDGKFERTTFQVKEKNHTFYFKSSTKPQLIRLDPDYKILFSLEFNPGDDMLIRQLKTSNTIGRILAAYELAKEGKKKNIDAIAEAYGKETFWGTKIEFARALSKSPSFHGIEALVRLLEEEREFMVLFEFISSMEQLRDEIVAEAMKKFLKRDETLYRATSAALNVLGAQRTKEAYDYLSKYKIGVDNKHFIRAGLYTAIGKIRSKKALEYVLEHLPYGVEPEAARFGIIQGVVEAALWADEPLKERTIEILIDMLKSEKNPTIVMTIARELSRLKETKVISAFEMVKEKLGEQAYPTIDRLIKAIQKSKTPDEETKKLRKDIDELKETNKKLLARIEDLEAKLKEDEEEK